MTPSSDTAALRRRIDELEREIAEMREARLIDEIAELKYRTLFEASIDALSILDLETGQFIDCNMAAVRLHDTDTKEGFLGLRPDEISPEFQPCGTASRELAYERIQRAFSEGGQIFEWVHCDRHGVPFPALVSLTGFTVGGRNLVMAIGRDISDLKETERQLSESVAQLTAALDDIRTLRGIIPICAYCKHIRSDGGAWQQLETYVSEHSDADFSHGICPSCETRVTRELDAH